jgi:hypothetical protein
VIRFVQFEVPWADVHGAGGFAEGIALPIGCEGWEPFQVRVHEAAPGLEGEAMICLAVWLRRAA